MVTGHYFSADLTLSGACLVGFGVGGIFPRRQPDHAIFHPGADVLECGILFGAENSGRRLALHALQSRAASH